MAVHSQLHAVGKSWLKWLAGSRMRESVISHYQQRGLHTYLCSRAYWDVAGKEAEAIESKFVGLMEDWYRASAQVLKKRKREGLEDEKVNFLKSRRFALTPPPKLPPLPQRVLPPSGHQQLIEEGLLTPLPFNLKAYLKRIRAHPSSSQTDSRGPSSAR